MMPEIQALEDQANAVEWDVRTLVTGLTEERGAWRPSPDSWSIAECLDHMAICNRACLSLMEDQAIRGRIQHQTRGGPAVPGTFGSWFVSILEPPVKSVFRLKTSRALRPRTAPPLADAVGGFLSAHRGIRLFLRSFAHLDLAGIHCPNPLASGVSLSLATGLNSILAHERRHLNQAWRIRREALASHPVSVQTALQSQRIA
jgi:hypothetical protein